MSGIEAKKLTKKFGTVTAVNSLSFEIREGEVFGFLGPNGAGKTTTIRMLACLMSPTSGSASVKGFDILKEPIKVREVVGILTENPSLYERLTAYENMNFFAQAYGIMDSSRRTKKIKELLDFFGLWERRNEKTGGFSKGMKQKLAIARSLVHEPEMLFLDEPTAGLDPEAAKEIRDLIERLSHEERRTVLLCTHHLEDAEKLADRVMIINKGKSLVTGTPEELEDKIAGRPRIEIKLARMDDRLVKSVKSLNHVSKIERKDASLIITAANPSESTPEIVKAIVRKGGRVLSVSQLRPSLEDAYLKIIKEEKP
jgi:ABC-2 type transport system ATP-binding protein